MHFCRDQILDPQPVLCRARPSGLKCCREIVAGVRFRREGAGAQYLTDGFAEGYLPKGCGAFQEVVLSDYYHVKLICWHRAAGVVLA